MYVNKMDKKSPDCQVSPDELNKESVQKKNQLLASFLGQPDYYAAYRLAMEDPTIENLERLDRFFKEFYFDIRFTSYISSTIYFNAINFDKRQRIQNSRHSLTLDATIPEGNGSSFAEMLGDAESSISLDAVLMDASLPDQVASSDLFAALQTLTAKQLQILELSYVNGLNDTEIGIALSKSQQTVSKTRKRALKALRFCLEQQNSMGKQVSGDDKLKRMP